MLQTTTTEVNEDESNAIVLTIESTWVATLVKPRGTTIIRWKRRQRRNSAANNIADTDQRKQRPMKTT